MGSVTQVFVIFGSVRNAAFGWNPPAPQVALDAAAADIDRCSYRQRSGRHVRTYTDRATERDCFAVQGPNPGLYVCHCASPHIPTHIANGPRVTAVRLPGDGVPDAGSVAP